MRMCRPDNPCQGVSRMPRWPVPVMIGGMDRAARTRSFSRLWIIASYIPPAILAASGLMIADVFYGNGNFFVAVLAVALATVGLPALADLRADRGVRCGSSPSDRLAAGNLGRCRGQCCVAAARCMAPSPSRLAAGRWHGRDRVGVHNPPPRSDLAGPRDRRLLRIWPVALPRTRRRVAAVRALGDRCGARAAASASGWTHEPVARSGSGSS